MDEAGSKRFLGALAKILAPFLAVEAILTPFKDQIASKINDAAHSVLPGNYEIVWACTGIDEVVLLASAIAGSPGTAKQKAAGILLTAAAFEAYNALRIYITSSHPDPLLHSILFRWGGFVLVLALFWAYVKVINYRPD